MSLKAKIEALLFVTDKPIRAQAIARIVNADVQVVRQACLELIHEFEERHGGLQISDEDGYSFQIKDEYASIMDEFMPVEMSAALIRTLSAIAIKQPISQSEIIRIRGAGAYDHIKELVIKELVVKKEESGERSPTLATTKKFQEYFRLSKEGKDLRNYLKRQVRKLDVTAAAQEAGQLVIPSVVDNNQADQQLNSTIYLETADMDEALEADRAEVESAGTAVLAADTPLAQTLSKLAAAANTPEPGSPAEVSSPASDEEMPTSGKTPAAKGGKANVQAATSKKKEPGLAGGKKSKNPNKGRLEELLNKQKLFQEQLKLGFPESEGEPALDFQPPVVNRNAPAASSIDNEPSV